MSLKKIYKDQPNNFKFTSENLLASKKIIGNYPEENNKVLS